MILLHPNRNREFCISFSKTENPYLVLIKKGFVSCHYIIDDNNFLTGVLSFDFNYFNP